MTLLISFSRHIDTVFVAQIVPNGVVGIMAGANSVDVQAFHNLNILNHSLTAYHVAAIGVQFMAVSTLDENGLPVHEQLGILDFNLAETNLLGDNFNGLLFGKFAFSLSQSILHSNLSLAFHHLLKIFCNIFGVNLCYERI